MRSYYKPRPEQAAEYRRQRKERLAAARAIATHTKAEWLALVGEFDACVRCGAGNVRLQKDHIIPLYQGGSDGIDNIQPICARCNAQKGPEDFNWAEYRRNHGFSEFAFDSSPQTTENQTDQ